MKIKFLIIVLLRISTIAYAMEKEALISECLYVEESLPPEIQYIIFEDLLTLKLQNCQTFNDFKRLKKFLSSISPGKTELFKKIINTQFNHFCDTNINTEQAYKLFTFFIIENNRNKTPIEKDHVFSLNRVNYNLNLLYYYLSVHNNSIIKNELFKILKRYIKVASINRILISAVFQNNINKVQTALINGANPNIITHDRSILQCAITTGENIRIDKSRRKILKILINAGANVNFISHDGLVSPLLAASMKGSLDFVKILLEAGSDPTFRNFNGWTPYAWAKYYQFNDNCSQFTQYTQIAKLLEEYSSITDTLQVLKNSLSYNITKLFFSC